MWINDCQQFCQGNKKQHNHGFWIKIYFFPLYCSFSNCYFRKISNFFQNKLLLSLKISGLQCYSTTVSLTEGLTPTLKNCSENTVACQITSSYSKYLISPHFYNIIAGNKTYTGQSCSPIKLYTGCVTLQGVSSCFCTSDG